ncbi:MAG: hypothetical protein QOH49_3113 [Acidobacteriota bacterium]|jgi:chromosome segregation ATPase|nr:hypothetical protein [Acidobacteriota bacterium]
MSSSEQDRVRELAERVARRLSDASREQDGAEGSGGGELAAVRASLAEIQRRLTHIESQITHGEECEHGARQSNDARSARDSSSTSSTQNPATQVRSTWLSGTYVPAISHPSQEQFEGLGEAVSELVEFFEREKTCTLEPGDKPCDHCGQCSARGF